MKKSLFAIAATTALAGVAHAQSSVTVYGILDLGYIGSNARVSNNTGASAPSQTNLVTNTQSNQFSDAAESTSRLGFKGTEDLGGGLSAFFTVETALAPNTQNAIQTNTTSSNRQTFVGLKKNGLGQFAFGTQYTTIHNAVSATDPGQTNNMAGNVIYDKFAGSSATNGTAVTAGTGALGGTAGTWQYSGQQNNSSYAVRVNNMLSLQSETVSGFQGNAFVVLSANNTNGSQVSSAGVTTIGGGSTNHTGMGLGLNFTGVNKLMLTANFQQFKDKQAFTTNTANQYTSGWATMGYGGGSSTPGINDVDTQQYYAATYDFGILKGYLQYVGRKVSDINNSNNYTNRTAQQIGVRSFITPTVEAWASAGMGKYTINSNATGTNSLVVNTSGAAGSVSANFGGYQLGSNYWLSKRTNLYAIYGQQYSSNLQATGSGVYTSYNVSNYALGLRHTF
jgi:predicted porin